jgi:sugar phosphate isomerase/epimerase
MFRGIGINCDDETIDGRLDRLDIGLQEAERAGFDAFELTIEAANVIRGGHVIQEQLERVRHILARYALHYTVHPPCNLRLTERSGLHRQVFLSCLDVSSRIGAGVMVYHSAQIALYPADEDTAPLPDATELQVMWQYETEMLSDMAHEAQQRNVVIAVENRDPHLWELAALRRHGKSAEDLTSYHAGMRLDLLAEQARAIASPNVGICLDAGHAFLAAPYWRGIDFLGGIRQAAPWIKHVHVHDNFGRIDERAESLRERAVFGEADNHMPPGWGAIPLAETLAILKQANYSGWLITELRPRYRDHMPEVASTLRALASE